MAVSVVDVPAVGYGHAREALLQATVELSARVGFHAVTVAGLSVAAGVGPRTFYNHFADLDDAFFEACEQMHDELRRAIRTAYGRAEETTRARVQACVEALVSFVQADPVRARALFVQSYAGGPAVVELRTEAVEWLIALLDGGDRVEVRRADSPEPAAVGAGSTRRSLLAEMAVGGVNEVICTRITAGELDDLGDLIPLFVDTLMRASTE